MPGLRLARGEVPGVSTGNIGLPLEGLSEQMDHRHELTRIGDEGVTEAGSPDAAGTLRGGLPFTYSGFDIRD